MSRDTEATTTYLARGMNHWATDKHSANVALLRLLQLTGWSPGIYEVREVAGAFGIDGFNGGIVAESDETEISPPTDLLEITEDFRERWQRLAEAMYEHSSDRTREMLEALYGGDAGGYDHEQVEVAWL